MKTIKSNSQLTKKMLLKSRRDVASFYKRVVQIHMFNVSSSHAKFKGVSRSVHYFC